MKKNINLNLKKSMLIAGCVVLTSALAKANEEDCLLESMGAKSNLTQKCQNARSLKVDEKSYNLDHVGYFNNINYVEPADKVSKSIALLDDAYVLLNWFPVKTVSNGRGKEIDLQLEVVKDSNTEQTRIILERPSQMDAKKTLNKSWFFSERFFTAFQTDHIAVPKENVLYIDQSESRNLVCSTGFWGNALDGIVAPVPYLGSQHGNFNEGAGDNFTATEYVQMNIRKLLTLEGKAATMTTDEGKVLNLVTIEYGPGSRGPIVGGIDNDALNEVKDATTGLIDREKVCVQDITTINPNVRVKKARTSVAKDPVLQVEKVTQSLSTSNRRGD